MLDGLSVSLTGQMAMEKRLATIANNVANSRTIGFRATQVRFEEVLKTADADRMSMVSKGEEIVSPRSGGLENTGNALDLAISGNAWFSVQTPAGNVMTKDGRFEISPEGQLTSITGDPVLDAGGGPIQIDVAAGPIDVGGDGVLRQRGNAVAGIGLYTFEPGPDFLRYGPSGFLANDTVQPLLDQSQAGVLQGYVEQSNVNPIQEITRLITVQRNFEQSVALSEQANQSLQRLIQQFTRS